MLDKHKVLRYTLWYMNDILKRIAEKKKRFDGYKPFPDALLKNFHEWFKIELTYTSNAIEGNTLSRAQTALIVEKGITTEGKSITEHLEAVNHAKALDYIQTLTNQTHKDITEHTILDIHAIILHSIDPTNAGRYRTVPVRIAGSSVILPNYIKVPDLMSEYIRWMHQQHGSVLQQALNAHFKLVSIHPFTDGNGRAARLLFNLLLTQSGYPPAIIRKEDRSLYINSIEKGQLTGNLADYQQVMLAAVERSLDIYLEALEEGKKLMKIGEVAKLTGESVPTIRYWTHEGLLSVAEKTKGGYQLYDKKTLSRVKKIRQLQSEKRLTIAELKHT